MQFSTWLAGWRMSDDPVVIDLEKLIARYRVIEDQRHARGRRYPLWVLLTIATLAKLAGVNDLQSLADWARERTRELCRLFSLWYRRMPAATTWARVLGHAVQASSLGEVITEVWQSVEASPPRGSVCLALDGKVLRGTVTLEPPGTHLLAAYVPATGLVLAQVEVGSEANEVSAAPQLLAMVDLRGKVVTGDALFAQRELSLQIVAAGGDYLWRVKENQPKLREAIATVFRPMPKTPGWGQPCMEIDMATTGYEKGHGRLEKRTLYASSILQGYLSWPGVAQVYKVETISVNCATKEQSTSTRYGVTSLLHEVADARRLLQLEREHWGIESGLHYRRDIDFAEDRCHSRMGQAGHLNATLNNIAIAVLHGLRLPSLAAARRHATYLVEHLIAAACFT